MGVFRKKPAEFSFDRETLLGDPLRWMSEFQGRRKSFAEAVTEQQKALTVFNEKAKASLDEFLKAQDEFRRPIHDDLLKLAPFDEEDVRAIPRRRAAYSDRMAALLAKLSMLAYIPFEEAANRTVLETILKEAKLELLGTIAVGDTECIIVESDHFIAVAFRGTTSKTDRRTDTSIAVERVKVENHPLNVRVHKGFYDAYRLAEEQLHAVLHAAPNKAIYLTGHSLGGAIALVASAALGGRDDLGPRIAATYTFGSPRVGGRDFPEIVKAPHYRVVNGGDVVALLPPTWLSQYVHTGDPYLLKNDKGRPVRRRPGGSIILLLVFSVLLWPFMRRLAALDWHDIGRYAARLDRIARRRGRWS